MVVNIHVYVSYEDTAIWRHFDLKKNPSNIIELEPPICTIHLYFSAYNEPRSASLQLIPLD